MHDVSAAKALEQGTRKRIGIPVEQIPEQCFLTTKRHEKTWHGLIARNHTDFTRTGHGLYTTGHDFTRTGHDLRRTGHGLYTDGTRTGHGLYGRDTDLHGRDTDGTRTGHDGTRTGHGRDTDGHGRQIGRLAMLRKTALLFQSEAI